MTDKLQLSCPKCGSRHILSKKTGVRWCRHCGYEGPALEFESKGDLPKEV